jgi:hypothetical protein
MRAKLASVFAMILRVVIAFVCDPLGIKRKEAERRSAEEQARSVLRAKQVEAELLRLRKIGDEAEAIRAARQAREAEAKRVADEALRAAAEKAQRVETLKVRMIESVRDGQVMLSDKSRGEAEAIRAARLSHDDAKAAFKQLETLAPDTVQYKPIKQLDVAISKAQAKMDKALAAVAEAQRLREAAAEAEAKKAKTDAERAERDARKAEAKMNEAREALTSFETAITTGIMLAAHGSILLAQEKLKEASNLRKTAKVAGGGQYCNDLHKQLTQAIDRAIKAKAEAERKAAEEQALAEKETKQREANLAWLETFFKGKHESSTRCAVCFAQAKNLVASMKNPPRTLKRKFEDMASFLRIGYDEFGVQLCDINAGQALDAAGSKYGHRIFGTRGVKVVDSFLDVETGEVNALSKLEKEMGLSSTNFGFNELAVRWMRKAKAKTVAKVQQKTPAKRAA